MIKKLIIFAFILTITLSLQPSKPLLSKEQFNETILRRNQSKLLSYTVPECIKFWVRFHPNDAQYERESEQNQKLKMLELCKPCLFSAFSGWCTNCCRNFVDRRKLNYTLSNINKTIDTNTDND